MELFDQIQDFIQQAEDPFQAIEQLRQFITSLSPNQDQPVDLVYWIPLEQIQANDYNPNSVAIIEMQLLATSIEHDGYTQPIVAIYDPNLQKYIIVDGFHRYFVMLKNDEIRNRCHGRMPVTLIMKDINDRMASTIRHNRARGKHSVSGMSNMVFMMLDNGWSDAEICNELGMEPEELLRLKHITGFSKLFENTEYNRSWMSRRQILIKHKYQVDHPEEKI